MFYILQSDSKPTVHVNAEQVVLYQMRACNWAIYKIKRESGEGFLYLVIEVYNPNSIDILEAEEYRNYHDIVSEPVNEKALIELIGISDQYEREILNELGIDWEQKTAILYGAAIE